MQFLALRLERVAAFVLLLLLEGMFWSPQQYLAGPHVNHWADDPYNTVLFATLIGFLAVACTLRAGAVIPVLLAAWPIAPLLLFAYASAAWSEFPAIVVVHTTKIAAVALFGIYLLARDGLGKLISLLVKAGLVIAVASFVAVAAVPDLARDATHAGAWQGAFTDKNELGMNAALGLVFAIYAFRKAYGSRWVSGLLIPADLVLLYLSNSRTPIVMLLATLYVAVLWSAFRRRDGIGVAVGFAIAAIGAIGALTMASWWQEFLIALGRDATLSERTRIWSAVIPYIAQRPWFGAGVDSFWLPESLPANQIATMLNWRPPSAHNLWLELALDLGFIGCALAAFIWLAGLLRSLRLLFRRAETHVVFAAALMTGTFVEDLTEYAFFRASFLWLVFVAVFAYCGRALSETRVVGRPAGARLPSLGKPGLLEPVMAEPVGMSPVLAQRFGAARNASAIAK